MSRDWTTGILVTLASLALVVLSVLLASARAAPPCVDPVDMRPGDVVACEGGTLMPEYIMRYYYRAEDQLRIHAVDLNICRVDLKLCEQKIAACTDTLGVGDIECRELLAIERDARRAAEEAIAPPPPPKEEPPAFYEKWSFWVGTGLAVAALGVGLSTEDHPLVWAVGGFGLGVVVGGEL